MEIRTGKLYHSMSLRLSGELCILEPVLMHQPSGHRGRATDKIVPRRIFNVRFVHTADVHMSIAEKGIA